MSSTSCTPHRSPAIPLFRDIAGRTVTTLHADRTCPTCRRLFGISELPLVSISHAQRDPIPHANFAATVHHGLPLDLHKPVFSPAAACGLPGRISRRSGPTVRSRSHRSVRRAAEDRRKGGKVGRRYFQRTIEPMLDGPGVRVRRSRSTMPARTGFRARRPRCCFRSTGRAVRPRHDRGDGLRSPVLAFRRGRLPEIIDDGVTGRIVDTLEEAVAALPECLRSIARLVRPGSRNGFRRPGWPGIM